jgi:hypothetical protein
MPTVRVDRTTFSALTLAQAAITYARKALPYGSANQCADLLRQRNGDPSGAQALARLDFNRTAVDTMLALPHGALPASFGANPAAGFQTYASALSAGVSMYYGAGNCGEHAYLTFHFLTTFGFPGLRITCVSSTAMDHAYTVISWQGCTDWIVCDAWPSKPQACRWSEFFANSTRSQTNPAFKALTTHEITSQNMGTDLIGEAFQLISPTFVRQLPLASRATGYTRQVIVDYLRSRPRGVYDHTSVLTTACQPYMDYQYMNDRGATELLSQTALPGEQWTARLAKVILEVNNQLHVLNPAQRYTAAQQVA